jgi:hypothetical protein
MKGKVHLHNPRFVKELTANIRNETFAIPVQQFRHVYRNLFSLSEGCLEAQGHQFEILL